MFNFHYRMIDQITWADPEGGGALQNYKKYRVCNTGSDPLKNHKTTKPGLMLGHHRQTHETPFKCVSLEGR